MKIKRIICYLVIGLLVSGVLTVIGGAKKSYEIKKLKSIPMIKRTYILHGPIVINGDSDFNAQFPSRIISGYEINGGNNKNCIYVGNCSQSFIIKDCYLHNGTYGIYFDTSSNGSVLNNNCTANLIAGIYLTKASNNTLMGDIFNDNSYCGIYLYYYAYADTLKDNNCSGNLLYGIYLQGANTNTVMNNNVTSNKGDGIRLDNSNINNTISYNNIYSNNWNGTYLLYSNTNTISNNNITSNNMNGIFLSLGSSRNIFTGNNCSKNKYNGIYLSSGNTNTLTNNKLQGNIKYGINIGGDYNRIYHNNIINDNGATSIYNSSHVQAYDNSGNNFWNSSYPFGGNYWSDWTSPDVMKGPYQNISGSDGIVDSPYLIDGSAGAMDHYPLVHTVVVPETPLSAPLIIICVFMLTAIVVRCRKR